MHRSAHGAPSPRTQHALQLFAGLSRRYDLMAEALSCGQNGRWRRFLVSRIATPVDGRVLDVATGTGPVALALACQTGACVVGLDQSAPMLRTARRKRDAATLREQVSLVLGKGEQLPFPDATFDAVTFTYLLRYVDDPGATLQELSRVLRPGGTLAGLEFHRPDAGLPRALWWLYTRVGLPLGGLWVSRSWFTVGRFLGPSISDFARRYPLPAHLALWQAAGVPAARAHVMSLGGGVVIWGRKGEQQRQGEMEGRTEHAR